MIRFLFVFLSFVLCPMTAWAQENAVIVVPFGALQTVPVRDLDLNQNVISLGEKRVVPTGEDVRVSDIKVLPDGSFLLADVGGRGYALTNKDGGFRYEFDPQKSVPLIRTAAVGNYFAPGEPSVIALADSASQFAFLRDQSSNQVIWAQNMRLGQGNGELVSIAVQPENKVSVAANYPALGLSIVNTYSISKPQAEPFRLANIVQSPQPPNTILIPAIKNIRDMMVLENGSYLLTTNVNLLNISKTGEVIWSVSIGDFPNVGGEFSSARKLPSGLIAVTTYQPGEWTRPHTNHRVHWLDPATKIMIAHSDVFSSAPVRVEPLLGHGGTGTSGFEAGLNDISKGDYSKVKVLQLNLAPAEIERGDRLRVSALIKNTDHFLVGLKTIRLSLVAGSCELPAGNGAPILLIQATNVTIAPDGTYVLTEQKVIDDSVGLGDWCASIEIVDLFDHKRVLEKKKTISVVDRKSETGSKIEVTDLPFHEGATDFGSDLADMGSAATEPGDGGCCGTIVSRRGPLGLVIGIFGLLFWRRRVAFVS